MVSYINFSLPDRIGFVLLLCRPAFGLLFGLLSLYCPCSRFLCFIGITFLYFFPVRLILRYSSNLLSKNLSPRHIICISVTRSAAHWHFCYCQSNCISCRLDALGLFRRTYKCYANSQQKERFNRFSFRHGIKCCT